jgi:type 1 glutamine amidotransferase
MRLPVVPLIILLAGSFSLAASAPAAPAAPGTPKILVFTKSSGFQHDAIKTDDAPGHGYAFRVLQELGEKARVNFVYSKDGSLLTPEYLAQFAAVVFYTTGDLTQAKSDPSGDGLPPMTPAAKNGLLKAIAGGMSFIGIHSATDTFHSFGHNGRGPGRYQNDGENADEYIKMIGGEFIWHGAQQRSRLIVADGKFPGIAAVPAGFAPEEEWYSLKNFAPDLHVLLVQDTANMSGPDYARAPYPQTWVHLYGKGRVFYTSMGHREDIWRNPVFQAVLHGGLEWALHRLDADITPNLGEVAPQANALPAYVPPPPIEEKKPE